MEAYKRQGRLEGFAELILTKTLLDRFCFFQLSSFDSMSHSLQPKSSLAIASTNTPQPVL